MSDFKITLQTDRINNLKALKNLGQKFLKENIEASSNRNNSWQTEVINNNIIQLKRCIAEIKKELHPKALAKFISDQDAYKNSIGNNTIDTPFEFLRSQWIMSSMFMELGRYSYKYSIINDMYWIEDGTVQDHFSVVMGVKTVEVFEKYCEEKIEFIVSTMIPQLRDNSDYSHVVELLVDLVNNYNSLSYLSLNILLHSIIESTVRSLCTYIYCKQNPEKQKDEVKLIISTYQSLENLITKANWKNDRPIDIHYALLLQKYIKDSQLESAARIYEEQINLEKELIKIVDRIKDKKHTNSSEIEGIQTSFNDIKSISERMINRKDYKINISLKVDLQFLVRRYKENRNSIVHGHFANFNKKWYCYINLSAVKKIYDLIETYQNLYRNINLAASE